MNLSRGFQLFKRIDATIRNPAISQMIIQTRNSGGMYSYRQGGYPPSKFSTVGAKVLMGTTWWWILWHLWHEPGHITGEFPYPNPSKWTDEELGIPKQ